MLNSYTHANTLDHREFGLLNPKRSFGYIGSWDTLSLPNSALQFNVKLKDTL